MFNVLLSKKIMCSKNFWQKENLDIDFGHNHTTLRYKFLGAESFLH
jgi:hypothetical protein